ncbi:MAG TPA: hypothetical protein VMS43_13870 [Allosphingosinicella sp.]|nr:hypothetical protein [Allosphingosinicella sp.]
MSKQEQSAFDAGPPKEGAKHRGIIGLATLALGGLGFIALFFVPIPEGNREPLMLALGLVLGWGGTVVNYEFGSSPAGRNAAAAGTRSPTG